MHEVLWSIDHPDLIVGLVEADGVTIAPSSLELTARIKAQIAALPPVWPTPELKNGVRDMLRRGGYKPSGRNKPASEYLIKVAQQGRFPAINNVVDINNLMSLQTNWPMSVLDRARAIGDAEALEVRFGAPDASYVFNSAGQEISLKGLLGLARVGGQMVGNPVKDAMVAKTDDASRDLIVALWATRAVATEDDVHLIATLYGEMLTVYAGAEAVRVRVLTGV